jgi:hypothetical protein
VMGDQGFRHCGLQRARARKSCPSGDQGHVHSEGAEGRKEGLLTREYVRRPTTLKDT